MDPDSPLLVPRGSECKVPPLNLRAGTPADKKKSIYMFKVRSSPPLHSHNTVHLRSQNSTSTVHLRSQKSVDSSFRTESPFRMEGFAFGTPHCQEKPTVTRSVMSASTAHTETSTGMPPSLTLRLDMCPPSADANYLSSDELTPMSRVELETFRSTAAKRLASRNDWETQFACIDSIRRLVQFDPEFLTSQKVTLLRSVYSGLCRALESPRSSICKNSMLCLREMFTSACLEDSWTTEDLAVCLDRLARKASTACGFLAVEAKYCIKVAAIHLEPVKLLAAVVEIVERDGRVAGKPLAYILEIIGITAIRSGYNFWHAITPVRLSPILEKTVSYASVGANHVRKSCRVLLALLHK